MRRTYRVRIQRTVEPTSEGVVVFAGACLLTAVVCLAVALIDLSWDPVLGALVSAGIGILALWLA